MRSLVHFLSEAAHEATRLTRHHLEHYQAFNAALPHHASLLNHLDATQSQIKEARNALQEAKETLGNKRADLVQLWTRNQTVEEMMRILDQMYVPAYHDEPTSPVRITPHNIFSEHLKSVPDALESLILEKRLLQAAALLIRSLKLINKPDMIEIGAVSDLRSYLVGQETVCCSLTGLISITDVCI